MVAGGYRSAIAASLLRSHGFADVSDLVGGYNAWARLTALIGIIPHWRAGRVRFAAGTIFGLAGVGGSLLGSHWNAPADPNILLLAFAGLMLVAAFGMWRRSHDTAAPVQARSLGAAAATVLATRMHIDAGTVLKVVVSGSVVGFLTGFFGVGAAARSGTGSERPSMP